MADADFRPVSSLVESVSSWLWRPRSGQLELPPSIAQRINQFEARAGDTLEDFLGCLLPSDRDRVEAELYRSLRSQSEFSVEFQVQWTDGIVRSFEMRGGLTATGEVAGFI